MRRPDLTTRIPIFLALALLLAPAAEAELLRYEIAAGDDEAEVRFRSEATLEDFEGHGNELSGWFEFDKTDLTSLSGELEFDLRSLDTGLGLRNKHMRDNVLETDDHPTARFVVTACEAAALTPEDMPVDLTGTLSLHGVSKEMTASVTVLPEGEALRIEARFRVKLSDHDIERPKMLIMKVAKEVELTVRALARPVPTEKEDSR